jgi:hypothetical protein
MIGLDRLPFAFLKSLNGRRVAFFVWLCLLTPFFTLTSAAHMTGVSYAEIEIGKQEIGVWLQFNLRELKFARQFDRNNNLLITEEEVQAQIPLFAPHLFEQFRIFGSGEEGQGRMAEVIFNPRRGELRCHLIYTFARPLEDVVFRVTLHSLTDSGHWDLARMRYDGVEEQRYFNLETPEGRVELCRGPQSYFRLAWRSGTYAFREYFSTPESVAFLLALILIEPTWEGLGVIVVMSFLGQALSFTYDTWRGPILSVRFVHSAIAISVAYVAAENVLIKEIRYRWAIAAFLGVIYGLSYSDLARSIGYPRKGMILSLLFFQLGLAVAMALLSVLSFASLRRLKEQSYSQQLFQLLSIGLIGFGLIRFAQATF